MKKIPENINKIISEFITAIKDTFGDRVKKIILYGSYARGDFNTSSDIDIMILTDFTDDEIVQYRSEIVRLAYDIEWNNKFDIHLSPLVKNIDRFNYWLEALPFYMNVQKEGVVAFKGALFFAQKSNIFNANFAEFVEEKVNL